MRGFAAYLMLCFLTPLLAWGQDIHFSQFGAAPLNYNPALTGDFDGDYRFIGNYRTQWSAVTVPYLSYGLSADASSPLSLNGVGAGVSFLYDKTGDSQFSTLILNLATAYTKYVGDSTHAVSFGGNFGFTNRTIDYSALQFGNQYNGFFFDGTINPNEAFTRDSRFYANVNLGTSYTFKKEDRKRIRAGVSLFNLTGPQQSFFDAAGIALDRRFNLHADAQWKLNDKFDVLPGLLWSQQGPFREIVAGSSAKYILINQGPVYRAVYAGIWGRSRDAAFISGGMDYDNWRVGLSYDLNLSTLRPASNNRGGFEVSVIYIVRAFKPRKVKHIICPDYI